MSPTFSTLLYALILVVLLVPLVDIVLHYHAIPLLWKVTTPESGKDRTMPRLSVIVPARNEEAAVRAAVASMVRQDYSDLEVILVNDRSTDRTGPIMSELAAAHPGKVRMISVKTVPDGWLGKNHALWLGTRHATGDWLLFVDADVHFDPSCFRRAVVHSEAVGLDHLTLLPTMHTRGYWLNAFISFFLYGFLVYQRPYRVNDPTSDVGMGVGAFNLIRRTAYEQIGTHRAISLRPDDDLRLGKRVKLAGLRQQVADGASLMGLQWYTTLGEAVRGLEKNLFPGLDYSVVHAFGSALSLAVLCVTPYVAVLWATGLDRWLLLATIAVHVFSFLAANWQTNRLAFIYQPVFPLMALLFGFAILRSTVLALVHNGVRWRGTLYPLRLLRAQTGLESLPLRRR